MNFVYGQNGEYAKLFRTDLSFEDSISDAEWVAFSMYCGDVLGRISHSYFDAIEELDIDPSEYKDRRNCRNTCIYFARDLFVGFLRTHDWGLSLAS